jgi:hypothetical protein
VWGRAANDVYAFGSDTYGSGFGEMLHWDGAAWSAVETGAGQGLNAMWGSEGGELWAVGDMGQILRR